MQKNHTTNSVNYAFYLIADGSLCDAHALPQIIEGVINCGVTCVQLRCKNATYQQILTAGQALLNVLRPQNIPLIINDDVTIAKHLDADGAHLGQNDMDVALARKELGANKIIGLSIENEAQARVCANLEDVDYFGVGAVFISTTKSDITTPIGIEKLREIRRIIPNKPLVAIGGIDAANASLVLDCGVDGIAVASAVLSAHNPAVAALQLRDIINSSLSHRR